MNRSALLLLILTMCLALTGCVPGSVSATTGGLNFADDEKLETHWQKHGMNPQEFNPALTKEQYLQAAQSFFASEDPSIEKKGRDNGDALRYNPSTHEFGVLSGEGVIRTYFKPDSGADYWQRQ